MKPGAPERRLAAILFSDMQGYSRQMDADESGTLERLELHNQILRSAIENRGGIVIKTVGDAFMAEFRSSVAAVEAALDIQRALLKYNGEADEGAGIHVRIGVHVGDVVVQDGDLFGEAVNLAARLEPQAPVGEVCISESVFKQVRRRVNADATALGFVPLKNISEPLRLYALHPGDNRLERPPGDPADRPAPSQKRRRAAIAALLLIELTMLSWWQFGGARRGGSFGSRGGADLTLRIGNSSAPAPYDANSNYIHPATATMNLALETLLPAPGDSLEGPLERVELGSDGLSLRLHLRSGLWFHPHHCLRGGEAREANNQDLAYSLKIAAGNAFVRLPLEGTDAYLAGEQSTIEGITAPASGPVLLRFTRPFRAHDLALGRIYLLPAQLEGCEDPSDMRLPVGTGPYRFDASTSPRHARLVPWERYWQPLPELAEGERPEVIEVLDLDDPIAAVGQLATGELDLVWLGTADLPRVVADQQADFPELREQLRHPSASLSVARANDKWRMQSLLPIGARDGPLRSATVRRAVALSLDREKLAAASPRLGIPSGRLLSSADAGFHPGLRPQERALGEARKLLAQAGYGEGAEPLELLFGASGRWQGFGVVLKQQLAEAGIRLRLVDVDRLSNPALIGEGHVDLIAADWGIDRQEGEPLLVFFSLCSGVGGMSFLTPRVEALGHRLQSMAEQEDRIALYPEIEQAILDDALHIPLARPSRSFGLHMVVSPRALGVANPVSRRVTLTWRGNTPSLLDIALAD